MNKKSDNIIKLEAANIGYFSHGDEDSFFKWLDTIPCVKKVESHLQTIYIEVDESAVDWACVDELMGIFKRYNISLKQLAIFDREEFADWFRNKNMYWYEEIFGE